MTRCGMCRNPAHSKFTGQGHVWYRCIDHVRPMDFQMMYNLPPEAALKRSSEYVLFEKRRATA